MGVPVSAVAGWMGYSTGGRGFAVDSQYTAETKDCSSIAGYGSGDRGSVAEEAVFRAGQTEVLAQGLAFVFAAEEAAALQFGDDPVDEIVEAAGNVREHDVEPVAGGALDPFLHLVGDHRRSAHQGEAAIAAGDLGELTYRQIVAARAFDDTLAAALAGIALRDLRQRAIEVEARGVVAQRYRQRGDAAVGVHEAVEQCPLPARLGGGLADHHEGAGEDLDVIGVAPELLGAALDIGVVMPRVGELAAAGKDHLRGLGGELAAGIGGARLDDDRPALDRPGDIERAAHRQELALVVEHMHPLRVEIKAGLDIADKGVLGPAVPEAGHDIEELAGAAVALAMLHMLGQPEIECRVGVRGGDEVP